MNISKKTLMSFLMALTSLIAMAQPYYHVMKQDGSNLTEEARYNSNKYKSRVDMVPAEEKPKDAIGGKITIWRSNCDKSPLKRSFYFTKHGNVYYDKTRKKFYFEDSQVYYKSYYGFYKLQGKEYGTYICEHFKWGSTIDECIDMYTGSGGAAVGASETYFYFANPANLPKLQEDLGNEKWTVLSACEWEYVMQALGETLYVNSTYCFVIDTTPGKSLLRDYYITHNGSGFMSWEEYREYERKGLVFLPAAGYRKDQKIKYAGDCGYYWSSTPVHRDATWTFSFGRGSLDVVYNGTGQCVRLVILAD